MRYLMRISLFLPLFLGSSPSDDHKIKGDHDPEYLNTWRIMFWNVENLFDPFNDSLTEDDEFLPSGIRRWTYERYQQKLIRVYKVLMAAGLYRPPEIIGLCEIENRNVLFDLTRKTPLKHFNYRFVHYESPDRRGSDVAMLYNPQYVKILEEAAFPVDISEEGGGLVRDILYARVLFRSGDQVSIFINHWPSKYGGAGKTEGYRKVAAKRLRELTGDLLARIPDEPVIIMGDFNDPPESKSVSFHLGCIKPGDIVLPDKLYNLSGTIQGKVYGSYKYQGMWEQLDQFIVNGIMLSGKTGFRTAKDKFRIFAPPFLLEHDNTFGGDKPFRTYNGMTYHAGFSDHLPVYIDLEFKER